MSDHIDTESLLKELQELVLIAENNIDAFPTAKVFVDTLIEILLRVL